jgi:mRNA interferase RelE/StbE
MTYEIMFKPRAIKDLQSIPNSLAQRIVEKIESLRTDLAGDVKRLTDFTPEYRLRVGDYRILFEIESDKVIIYRVKHRSDAYNP